VQEVLYNMLRDIIQSTPIVGSLYGFYRTASRGYNTTTPEGAIKQAIKGIVLDCTLPVINYPVLCVSLACTGACGIRGNPVAIAAFVNTGRLIMEA
jgi:hypothetical protein